MDALPDFDKNTRFKTRQHFESQCSLKTWIVCWRYAWTPIAYFVWISCMEVFRPSSTIEQYAIAGAAIGGVAAGYFWIAKKWIPARRHFTFVALCGENCPACGQCIADMTPESDGCTICPECGGAWRVPGKIEGATA
ncbi:MAG: hypothetical protein EA376_07510 [Phycisphaeraceae bacterium]|nr:MAG: hypothetical protein EA376_07510 [Phycisphaeraceae bacterium]